MLNISRKMKDVERCRHCGCYPSVEFNHGGDLYYLSLIGNDVMVDTLGGTATVGITCYNCQITVTDDRPNDIDHMILRWNIDHGSRLVEHVDDVRTCIGHLNDVYPRHKLTVEGIFPDETKVILDSSVYNINAAMDTDNALKIIGPINRYTLIRSTDQLFVIKVYMAPHPVRYGDWGIRLTTKEEGSNERTE